MGTCAFITWKVEAEELQVCNQPRIHEEILSLKNVCICVCVCIQSYSIQGEIYLFKNIMTITTERLATDRLSQLRRARTKG